MGLGQAGLHLFVKTQLIFLISSFLLLLALGHISGCVYYNSAMLFDGKEYTGRIIGVGMGCAVVMQYVVQNLFVTDAAFLLSMVFSVAVLLYIIIKPTSMLVAYQTCGFEPTLSENFSITSQLSSCSNS